MVIIEPNLSHPKTAVKVFNFTFNNDFTKKKTFNIEMIIIIMVIMIIIGLLREHFLC